MNKIKGEQIGFNFGEETHIRKDKNLESKIKSEKTSIDKIPKSTSTEESSSQYSEEYIKNTWTKDYYIFDVRDYESIGKLEWKDWPKEITRDTVTEMVNQRNFSNSGHSSYLIEIMLNNHGWTEEQIVDYVLKFREVHLKTLKNEWKNSIINAPEGFRNNLEYLKEIYSYYFCCCKNLNEKPEPFDSLVSLMKKVK